MFTINLMRTNCDGKSIALEDESYFILTGLNVQGNREYFSSDRKTNPPLVKYAGMKNIRQRLIVWAAKSEKGVRKVEMVDRTGYLEVSKRNLKVFFKPIMILFQTLLFGLNMLVPMMLDGYSMLEFGKYFFRLENCKSA